MRNPIVHFSWFITEDCNLRCKHCCVANPEDECFIGELEFKDIAKALYNVKSWGVKHIHFLGGEPTFRKDFLEILTLCKALGLETSFNTNGQLIDYSYAKKLVEVNVQTVTFSFEGPDAETNDQIRGNRTFENSIKAIHYLKQARNENGRPKPPLISLEIGLNRGWSSKIELLELFLLYVKPECVYLEATQAEGRALKDSGSIVLEPNEQLELMPKLSHTVAKIQNEVPIHLRFFPKWVEYGNIISQSKASCADHLCLALTPQCYVTGNGKAIPCTYTYKAFGLNDAPDVISSSLNEVLSSPHFQKFLVLWKNGIKLTPKTCRFCGYRFFMCEVCPVAPQEVRETSTHYCQEAMQRIAEFKKR